MSKDKVSKKTINNLILLRTIFSDENLRLPLEIKLSDNDQIPILSLLSRVFINYQKIINKYAIKLKIKEEDKVKITLLINLIKTSVESYLKGETATTMFMASTNNATINIFDLLPKKFFTTGTSFYRFRKHDDNFPLSRKDLFHIPFQLRNKVPTQRFSIPGIPCLYCSTSAYVCWEEMNRPNFDTIQLASFVNKDAITLFDLSFQQFEFPNQEYTHEEIVQLILAYPLIAACSVSVPRKNQSDPFKQEYIFPQILFQTLSSQNYTGTMGIVYSSSKVKNANSSDGIFENLVLTTLQGKSIKSHGYSQVLTEIFKMSEPLLGNLLFANANVQASTHVINKIMLNGLVVNYNDTVFALLEKILNQTEKRDIPSDFEGE